MIAITTANISGELALILSPFLFFIWFLPFNYLIRFAVFLALGISAFTICWYYIPMSGHEGLAVMMFVGTFYILHLGAIAVRLITIASVFLFSDREKRQDYFKNARLKATPLDPLFGLIYGLCLATGLAFCIKLFAPEMNDVGWVHPIYFALVITYAYWCFINKPSQSRLFYFLNLSAVIGTLFWGGYSIYYASLVQEKARLISKANVPCLTHTSYLKRIQSGSELYFFNMDIDYFKRPRLVVSNPSPKAYI